MDEEGIEIVGGHLVIADDFGVTLSTTHKMKTVVPEVTAVVREAIREAVEKLPRIALRLLAAVEVESLQGLYKLTRADQVKVVCFAEERKYVEQNTHKGLVKLSSPIMAFYSRDVIRTAEVTEDFNVMSAMSGLDAVLTQITSKEGTDEGDSDETGKDEKLEP
jgi:hypothetical protein